MKLSHISFDPVAGLGVALARTLKSFRAPFCRKRNTIDGFPLAFTETLLMS